MFAELKAALDSYMMREFEHDFEGEIKVGDTIEISYTNYGDNEELECQVSIMIDTENTCHFIDHIYGCILCEPFDKTIHGKCIAIKDMADCIRYCDFDEIMDDCYAVCIDVLPE